MRKLTLAVGIALGAVLALAVLLAFTGRFYWPILVCVGIAEGIALVA